MINSIQLLLLNNIESNKRKYITVLNTQMNKYLSFYIIISLLLLSRIDSQAQLVPHFSQSIWQQAVHNPGAVGNETALRLNGIVRTQWLGLNGSPMIQAVSADLPIPLFNAGIGFVVQNESLGAFKQSSFRFRSSFKIINNKRLLSVGVGIGMKQARLDGSILITPEGIYEEDIINHEDPLVDEINTLSIIPSADLGVYYRDQSWEAGAFVGQIIPSRLKLGADNASIIGLEPVFQAYINRVFSLSNDLEVKPSIWVYSDLKSTQMTGGLLLGYQKKAELGIFVRGYNKYSIDALIATVAYNVNNRLRVAYGFDYPLSSLNNFTKQSHEFTITHHIYSIFGGKKGKIIYNPRFL